MHTGECDIVGNRVAGAAIAIATHVARKADAGQVLVSSTVRDLVAGSGLEFADRGLHLFPEVPGEWRLFAVRSQS